MAKQILRVFADANVVVDLLSRRAPFHSDAFRLFQAAEAGRIDISVSAHSVIVAHYLLKRTFEEAVVRSELSGFLKIVRVVDVSETILREALLSSFGDFEDAVQYGCARGISDISCIVTRDPKHFVRSEIPVMSPLVFNAQYLD